MLLKLMLQVKADMDMLLLTVKRVHLHQAREVMILKRRTTNMIEFV